MAGKTERQKARHGSRDNVTLISRVRGLFGRAKDEQEVAKLMQAEPEQLLSQIEADRIIAHAKAEPTKPMPTRKPPEQPDMGDEFQYVAPEAPSPTAKPPMEFKQPSPPDSEHLVVQTTFPEGSPSRPTVEPAAPQADARDELRANPLAKPLVPVEYQEVRLPEDAPGEEVDAEFMALHAQAMDTRLGQMSVYETEVTKAADRTGPYPGIKPQRGVPTPGVKPEPPVGQQPAPQQATFTLNDQKGELSDYPRFVAMFVGKADPEKVMQAVLEIEGYVPGDPEARIDELGRAYGSEQEVRQMLGDWFERRQGRMPRRKEFDVESIRSFGLSEVETVKREQSPQEYERALTFQQALFDRMRRSAAKPEPPREPRPYPKVKPGGLMMRMTSNGVEAVRQ